MIDSVESIGVYMESIDVYRETGRQHGLFSVYKYVSMFKAKALKLYH